MILIKSEEIVREFYKERGISLFKPSWPDLVGWDKVKQEMVMVEVKGVGDRLSKRQDETFHILTKFGCRVEVAIIKATGEISRINFKEQRERLKIPGAKRAKGQIRKKVEKQLTLKELQQKHEEMMEELKEMKETSLKSQ